MFTCDQNVFMTGWILIKYFLHYNTVFWKILMMHSCTTEAFRSMKTNAKLLFALKDDLEVCDAEKN